MKKQLQLLLLFLAMANVYLCANSNVSSKKSDISLYEIERGVLDPPENDLDILPTICKNGGKGAEACSIEAGADVMGSGVSTGCSVTCRDGYYACCGFSCTCIEE